MTDLALTMACGPYDRMEALRYGAVRPQGVDLRYLAIQDPTEIFGRMLPVSYTHLRAHET